MDKIYECFRNEYLGLINKRFAQRKLNSLKREFPKENLELIQSNYLIIKNINKKIFTIIDNKPDNYFIVIKPKEKTQILLCVKNPVVYNIFEFNTKEKDKLSNLDFPDYYLPTLITKFSNNILNTMIPRLEGQIILSNSNKQIFNINDEKKKFN
jgi:hypothetical protein